MSEARYIIGDCRQILADIPDGSIDLILGSPPFLALRSYLPPGHPLKAFEMGSEPTPAEFLQALLELVALLRPKLTRYGSLAFELGDTYAGSGGAGGDYADDGMRAGQQRFDGSASRAYGTGAAPRKPRSGRPKNVDGRPDRGFLPEQHRRSANRRDEIPGWPMDKSLCGIPHLFHLSLAYGINLLTGEPSPAGRWRIRNVVAWARPNPPVGSLGDKFRPATSYLTIATIARDRYFDLDATRTPLTEPDRVFSSKLIDHNPTHGAPSDRPFKQNDGGAPPLDWWEPLDEEQDLWDQWADEIWQLSTAPYKGSHYATWPPALCVRPIESMVPQRVCTTCGEPSRRITEANLVGGHAVDAKEGRDESLSKRTTQASTGMHYDANTPVTVGWTDCGHDTWRRGNVLDPFAGSGTTLAVAVGHGRDAIGLDLDERNAELALHRVGPMFLTIERHASADVDTTEAS